MKHEVLAMRIHSGTATVNGIEAKMCLPEGCTGIAFVFESKKAAREWWGKDVPLIRVERERETCPNTSK